MTANYEPKRFEGEIVGVGERVISLQKLAEETGFSKSTVISALKKLEKTGEIKRKPTAKFTIVTLLNYTCYNEARPIADRKPTDSRPIADRKPTDSRPIADRKPTQWKKEESKKARMQEGKKEGADDSSADLPPSPEITPDFIISRFGQDNFERYTAKVRNWMKRKGIKGEPELDMIYKWLDEDRASLKLPGMSAGTESNFSIEEYEKNAYKRYKK
ncbi:MAG: hypothetical protein ACI4KR_10350 [Ruminiclostridium sp.]